MARCGLFDGLLTLRGQNDERAARVVAAPLARDEVSSFHPSHVMGDPAAFPLQGACQITHSNPALGTVGEVDQDLEVGQGQA